MPVIDPTEFKEKVERILSSIYGGLHNVPKKIKWTVDGGFQMAELLVYEGLATFDFSQLTTLVLAAHDECIRAELSACNPQYMRLRLWPRLRDGGMSQRHSTIEQALESFRKHYRPDNGSGNKV